MGRPHHLSNQTPTHQGDLLSLTPILLLHLLTMGTVSLQLMLHLLLLILNQVLRLHLLMGNLVGRLHLGMVKDRLVPMGRTLNLLMESSRFPTIQAMVTKLLMQITVPLLHLMGCHLLSQHMSSSQLNQVLTQLFLELPLVM